MIAYPYDEDERKTVEVEVYDPNYESGRRYEGITRWTKNYAHEIYLFRISQNIPGSDKIDWHLGEILAQLRFNDSLRAFQKNNLKTSLTNIIKEKSTSNGNQMDDIHNTMLTDYIAKNLVYALPWGD